MMMAENCGMKTLPKASAIPISSDPMNAPRIEPMPPITTMTKETISTPIADAGIGAFDRRGEHSGGCGQRRAGGKNQPEDHA